MRVNKPRDPLPDKMHKQLQLPEEDAAKPTPAQNRPLSDKEARIAELVRSIKEKQSDQEKRKNRFELYRPWLICGGVLIGGIVLQQIMKRIFY